MATENDQAADAPAAEALTLDEFCVRLSTTDRRPELLAGFHFVETRAAHLKDTEAAYRARFNEYVNTPV